MQIFYKYLKYNKKPLNQLKLKFIYVIFTSEIIKYSVIAYIQIFDLK